MPDNSCLKKDLLVLEITHRSDRELDEIKKILIRKIIEAEKFLNKKVGISKVILNLVQQESIEHLKYLVDSSKINCREDANNELLFKLIKDSGELTTTLRQLHKSRYESINQMIREAHGSLMDITEKLAIIIGDTNNPKIADGVKNVTIH
jgi:hypothetical protein